MVGLIGHPRMGAQFRNQIGSIGGNSRGDPTAFSLEIHLRVFRSGRKAPVKSEKLGAGAAISCGISASAYRILSPRKRKGGRPAGRIPKHEENPNSIGRNPTGGATKYDLPRKDKSNKTRLSKKKLLRDPISKSPHQSWILKPLSNKRPHLEINRQIAKEPIDKSNMRKAQVLDFSQIGKKISTRLILGAFDGAHGGALCTAQRSWPPGNVRSNSLPK